MTWGRFARNASALLFLASGLWAQETFEVQVAPPDNIFHFAPQVTIPGRPTLGLALSGGGARGVGHIGVLQRLDETGIPVDYIMGTSSGALMGTLYACGFSGKEIQALFERMDFCRVFLDPLGRNPGRTLQEDEAENGTLFTVQMDHGVPSVALGLKSGLNIQRTLEALVARGDYFSGGDFNKLKVPLRILATNLETGQAHVFGKGDLVEALRASMAVPGAFRPVIVDGQQCVDGAFAENIPVLAMRDAFHPDVVLAVDVSSAMETSRVSNFVSLATRSLDLVIENRQRDSRASASLVIRPDLKDVPFTDYGKRLPSIVEDSRAVFDAQEPTLQQKMLVAAKDDEILPATRVVLKQLLPEPAMKTIHTLLPEGGPIRRWAVLGTLQQMLVHGWVQSAKARIVEIDGANMLEIDAIPFGIVKGFDVDAPSALKEAILTQLRWTCPAGERFNPEVFGCFLSRWVHELVIGGSPLVDVRGSTFDTENGTIRVVVREPVLKKIEVQDGAAMEADYLSDRTLHLLGKPPQSVQLKDCLDLAEQRLHLDGLSYRLKPVEGGCELSLLPVHKKTQSLDVSLGYETTLGGMVGFQYGTENIGAFGAELNLAGSKNLLQKNLSLGIRRPFERFLGAGIEAQVAYGEQKLETRLGFPSQEIPLPQNGGTISTVDYSFGSFYRFGHLGLGKAEISADQRQAIFRQDFLNEYRKDRAVELDAEWDNFDRHTFPRQGLLLRGRYGAGRVVDGLDPQGTFRFGYFRARGLQPLGEPDSRAQFGLDLDVEWGYGNRLPLDRWWITGGPSFLIGSPSCGILTPNFAAGRFGVPWRMDGPFGLSLQVVPRFDYCVISSDPGRLFASTRAEGTGVVVRTMVSNFYVELAYGFLRTCEPSTGWSRTSGSFNALIGTKPFDLWARR